ncbi:hypothetical protein H8L32_04290 [Undibacterium sp. CY18W]|uniref:Uncharacterized protein n=1 Tax=Undibacterium hunanense TaxID=2762292 RepID=A0ABR6ZLD1_9BURK|nr:hypothetical protein [Undibacterium hunanense]MBC3916697.1 hypothetical protein [Undibacterium hunanense]
MQTQDQEFIANAIRHYLQQRPNSADTAEGINHFWINWPGDVLPTSVVLPVLENMRTAGELESVVVGGRTIWRAARSDN